MQFSQDSQNHYFFSQPHQPFFVLAFVSGFVTMLIFLLSYKGVLNLAVSSLDFHIYGLTYLMFTPAFLAFLFTTFPKFSSTPAIKKEKYMSIFSLFYLGSILFLLGSIVSSILSSVAMVLLFIAHFKSVLILKKIYDSTSNNNKTDMFWILLSLKFSLLAHFLFIIAMLFYPPLMGLSTEISTYLYLFLLTFSVAQRMVPFFSHILVEKNPKLLKIILTLLILHILLEGIYTHASFITDIALGYFIAKELLRWDIYFPNPNPLLWILHIALYWVPVAFILAGITNFISMVSDIHFLALDVHTLLLGFVFTMLIGFGTRVTLGHSGNTMQADKWTSYLFYWTQVVVVIRILLSFFAAFTQNFMILFDLSVLVWLIIFVGWGVRFFAVLITGKKLKS